MALASTSIRTQASTLAQHVVRMYRATESAVKLGIYECTRGAAKLRAAWLQVQITFVGYAKISHGIDERPITEV